MAKSVRDLERILNKKVDDARRAFFNKRNMDIFGKQARDIIYKRTKSGKGVASDTAERTSVKSLAALRSADYIAKRRRFGVPGRFGAPDRSNLTYSGQMLEALKWVTGNNFFKVFVDDNKRKRFPLSPGTETNKKIAEYVSEQGRPFLNMAVDELRIVTVEIQKMFTEEARKILKRRVL